ncbi:hypothetical protein R75461_07413 [Paraburkholderia nemoris]|uniref:hypothetical protein n=1 Tax=Paraburkholderia nemoris TaxID=2793076 RepID=UPI0019095202|nr:MULTISPECIES: hypothetical protein [Paraburkholderia]MBK3786252.1 hypothetical protein [Paraburkholderia aspalathi]CAE6849696.1 hypothetical protein R75461_07413 [Paraburkholderia nemoris]
MFGKPNRETFIAIAAAAFSAWSAYSAYQANKMKDDAISYSAKVTNQCQFEYHGGSLNGMAALCWTVTISNTSDRRLSIISADLENMNGGQHTQIGGFDTLETMDGKSLDLPISLDSGEARTILVKAPMLLEKGVNDALHKAEDDKHLDLSKMKLSEVNTLLGEQNTDLLGNKVKLTVFDQNTWMRSISSPFKRAENMLTLTTGRGVRFTIRLVDPPDLH